MKILGLIPARGGSKGIKKKNIKLLGGKPLIQFAIESVINSKSIDEVVVSTDDIEIAEISASLGATIPFIRPAHLAADNSPTIDTMVHLMEYYQNNDVFYDAICLLQPTSPFRTSEDIDKAVQSFKEHDYDSLISVVPVPHHFNPHWTFKVNEDSNTLFLSTGEETIIPRRQELPKAYVRNGAIYLTKADVILKQKSIYGSKIGYYEMDEDRSVNIDSMVDWEMAEEYLRNKT